MATQRKARKSAPRNVVVVSGTKRRRSYGAAKRRSPRRVSGSVGRTKTTRKRRSSGGGYLGATGSKTMQIGKLALGVAGGAIFTHVVMRPVEKMLTDKVPQAAKFIAAGEILLGGFMIFGSKHPMVKAAGIGVLANGVNGALQQLNVYKHLPGVSGPSDGYATINVPMAGTEWLAGSSEWDGDSMAGIMLNSNRPPRTSWVAGNSFMAATYDDNDGGDPHFYKM